MAQIVERHLAVVLELLNALADALVWIQQRAAEHTHFRFRGMWWQPIQRGRGSRRAPVAFWAAAFLEISARVGGTTGQRVGNRINHVVMKV